MDDKKSIGAIGCKMAIFQTSQVNDQSGGKGRSLKWRKRKKFEVARTFEELEQRRKRFLVKSGGDVEKRWKKLFETGLKHGYDCIC